MWSVFSAKKLVYRYAMKKKKDLEKMEWKMEIKMKAFGRGMNLR